MKITKTKIIITILILLSAACSFYAAFVTYQADKKPKIEFESKKQFSAAVLTVLQDYKDKQKVKVLTEKLTKFSAADNEMKDGKRIYGSLDARFTLVEFTDLSCPYCKQFHSIAKQAIDQSDENMNWELIDFPLSFHEPAASALAHAAECAAEQHGNAAYWAYIEEAFNHNQVSDVIPNGYKMGLNPEEFKECVVTNKYMKEIEKDKAKGRQVGINATPTVYIVDNKSGKSVQLRQDRSVNGIKNTIKSMLAENP